MLMTPLSIDPSSAGAPGEPAAGMAIGVADGGERFADQLAHAQSQLPAGQNLAAGALPLQTVALGPTLEVVTAPHGSPDQDSLAAFAKAQGLDDDVVAWLFSDATQAQVQAQALLPIQIPTGVMALPVSPNTGLVLGAAGAPGTWVPGLPPGTPVTPATPGLPLDPDGAAAAAAAVTAASWLQSQQAARLTGDAPTPGAVDPAQAATTPLPQAFLAAAQTIVRGARPDANAPAWQASMQAADMPVEILTLDIQDLESLDTLWDEPGATRLDTGSHALGGAGAGAGNGAGNGQSAGAGGQAASEDAAAPTPTGPRTAGYQELSQRLGEALAQRVIAQIERGNWEVRLLLKPAKLGEVEVDLALRSGALDASFRATNPATRDLLNDGLPRLREVLANAGMDIAGLNVGSGRSQQTGGNPTPWHAREPQGPDNADPGVVAASAPAMQTRLRGPGDGWDVLV